MTPNSCDCSGAASSHWSSVATKDLVAPELPAKQEQILDVELTPRHRKLYDTRLQRERQKVLGLLDDVQRNRFTILKSLTVLRQLALHPGLVDPGHAGLPSREDRRAHRTSARGRRQRSPRAGVQPVHPIPGQVRDRLDAEGIDHCYLDGRTRNRAKVIQRFKDGDAPVFLISLKAGGFGLNLTEADYCFLLDPWWNPAVEAQAVDRTHRIGQTRTVMVYRLIARGTIEDKVLALNARKAKLFAQRDRRRQRLQFRSQRRRHPRTDLVVARLFPTGAAVLWAGP